jgi:hypothetical protein
MALANRADNGGFDASGQVRSQPTLFDVFDDVVDLFLCCRGFHNNHHSVFLRKHKCSHSCQVRTQPCRLAQISMMDGILRQISIPVNEYTDAQR